jgi:hypothetical protein
MGYKRVAVLILAPLAAFALANAARHPAHASQNQNTQYQSTLGMPSGGIMGPGIMGSGRDMMGTDAMMSRMTAHQEAVCKTMDKLMESMTAIENEKDPAALKSKLAEHRALLEQMRDQVLQQNMMQSMIQEMGGKPSRIPPTPRVWK